jgi:hypothetical protein
MQGMLDNPEFVQQMSRMMSDPAIMDQIMASNPQLAAMGPQVRQMFQSEGFRNMLCVSSWSSFLRILSPKYNFTYLVQTRSTFAQCYKCLQCFEEVVEADLGASRLQVCLLPRVMLHRRAVVQEQGQLLVLGPEVLLRLCPSSTLSSLPHPRLVELQAEITRTPTLRILSQCLTLRLCRI